jgi:hypothetical protein
MDMTDIHFALDTIEYIWEKNKFHATHSLNISKLFETQHFYRLCIVLAFERIY